MTKTEETVLKHIGLNPGIRGVALCDAVEAEIGCYAGYGRIYLALHHLEKEGHITAQYDPKNTAQGCSKALACWYLSQH